MVVPASHRDGPRIDIHTHLLKPGNEPDEEELDAIIRLSRRFGIERLVQLGNLYLAKSFEAPDPEDIRVINSHTLKVTRRHPDVFIGFCYLNPANPASFSLEEIDRCVAQGGMRGLKFEVSVKATDKRYDPLMARAEALDIPVLHHAWYNLTGTHANESTPAEIADLARRFPGVTVVMAHLGGAGERGVLDIADLPNVLIDTAGSWPESALVEYAVRRLGAHRVVYGSDWPIRDFGAQTGRILGADLEPEERELIFRGNAARVLGLEGGA